jgi:hypothetical protein
MAKKLKKIGKVKKFVQGGYNMGTVSQMKQNPYYLDKTSSEAAQTEFESTQRDLQKAGKEAQLLAAQNEQKRKADERKFLSESGQDLIKAAGKDLLTATQTGPVNPTIVNTGIVNPVTGQPFNMSFGKTTGGTQGVEFSKFATGEGAGVVGETAKTGLRGAEMSNLATAGIGAGLTGAGILTERLTDDKSDFTTSQTENTGNLFAETTKGAGSGFVTGATLGSIIPGVGNVVGGTIGGIIGAGAGFVKGRRENREAKDLSEELLADQAARRNAFQNAYVQSRLTGIDTGFGLKSSTNMNNQFTNSYMAKKGGFKKLPGGVEIDLPGGAKKYIGNTHAEGGIMESSEVEVENNETKDKIEMAKGGKVDYFFSEYLKLGNKSFAKRHEDMVKSGASQEQIQALARKQEEVAGRNPKQVAMYGGVRKYAEGGVGPCPEGYIMDEFGNCIPASEQMYQVLTNSSTFTQPAKEEPKTETTGKPIDQKYYRYYMQQKAAEQEKAKLQAEIDQKAKTNPQSVLSAEGLAPNRKLEGLTGIDATRLESQRNLKNAWQDSQNYDYEILKAIESNLKTGEIDPKTGKKIIHDYSYDPATGYYTDKEGTGIFSIPRRILFNKINKAGETAPVPEGSSFLEAYRELPEDVALLQKEGYYKKKNGDGTTKDWMEGASKNGKFIDFKDNLDLARSLGYEVPEAPKSSGTKTETEKRLAANVPEWRKKGIGLMSEAEQGITDPYAVPSGVAPQVGPAVTQTAGSSQTGAGTTTQNGAGTVTTDAGTTTDQTQIEGLNKPRFFMGFSRKVDPVTGEVTVDKNKPLTGTGDMAGSRLGTTTGDEKALEGVLANRYDIAWQNKADNLYAKSGDVGTGKLAYSNYITDRDKIAESNWGEKFGYYKGMSAEEAKEAHNRFVSEVNNLFSSKPDEILGYFQYIVDGGDPKSANYLGEDAQQIRSNLKKEGYIDANGKVIPGKESALSSYLQRQATNNAVGPIHNALGSYTAETGASKIKIEEPPKEENKPNLEKRVEPCPPGQYRSSDGSCKPIPGDPRNRDVNATMLAGLGQLIPAGYAMFNPYKIGAGVQGTAAIQGALLPRMNMNQERASAIDTNVAMTNAIRNTNTGPGGLAMMLASNRKLDEQMLKIAKQEQDANKELAGKEAQLGQAASQFNAENELKRQMFNTEFKQKERQYKREEFMGALDTAMRNIAGVVKDDRAFKSQERLAKALDETGSYDRFTIYEALEKEAKRKNSPYTGMSQSELRRIAAAIGRDINPEGYVSPTEYASLKSENEKLKKDKEESGKAKYGGARQYVSRLGQLNNVRSTKPKFNI